MQQLPISAEVLSIHLQEHYFKRTNERLLTGWRIRACTWHVRTFCDAFESGFDDKIAAAHVLASSAQQGLSFSSVLLHFLFDTKLYIGGVDDHLPRIQSK